MRPSTRLVVLGRKLWTPAALGLLLALWLDANDSSTITLNGFTVSEWQDKSGNNRHASQATVGSRPTYSKTELDSARLTFNNQFLSSNYSINGLSNVSVFVVGSSTETAYYVNFGYDFSVFRGVFVAQSTNNNYYSVDGRPYGGDFIRSTIPPASNQPAIIYGNITNTGIQAGANGLLGTVVSYSTPSIQAGNFTHLFKVENVLNSGSISEVIVIQGAISTNTRQYLEGYLAHKWNLVNRLPNNHPFRFTPPFV